MFHLKSKHRILKLVDKNNWPSFIILPRVSGYFIKQFFSCFIYLLKRSEQFLQTIKVKVSKRFWKLGSIRYPNLIHDLIHRQVDRTEAKCVYDKYEPRWPVLKRSKQCRLKDNSEKSIRTVNTKSTRTCSLMCPYNSCPTMLILVYVLHESYHHSPPVFQNNWTNYLPF